MCTGVTMGFAGIKFSGSPISQGPWKQTPKNKTKNNLNPNASLTVKYGWNGDLSKFPLSPRGLDEPVSCKKRRWTPLNAAIKKGSRKCKEKKRVSVALPTANPPHSQKTISSPTMGTADAKFVITVAPQNDIWPQGKTYPKNAVPITANKIRTPTTHVFFKLKDP